MRVKRWKFIPASEGRPAHMKKDQTGAYVEKHSYETLRASHEELEKALRANNLQLLQSDNDSDWAREANQMAIAALANAQKVREG